MQKKEGTKTIERLKKYMDEGLTIVVCEPSCASAFNDDLADMIEDDIVALKLKKHVVMIDIFLAKEIEAGNINIELESVAENVLSGACN